MKTRLITLFVFCVVILVGAGIYQKIQGKSTENTATLSDQTNGSPQAQSQNEAPAQPTRQESASGQNDQLITQDKSLQKPAMEIDTNKEYTATLHTSDGDIVVSLNAKQTPITVNNFVALSKKGFYDNTIFHRVIKGFMIQGGDPKGDGTGGPGYRFDDEKFEGDYTRGTIAMANAGPNTNGSQFFIMHQDYALSKDYVIFGHVIQGMDTVDKIATAPVAPSARGESSRPVNPVTVKSVDISEK